MTGARRPARVRAGEPSRRDTYRWERPLPEGGSLSSLPSRLEPQPSGAVTCRAVAQRRSRASGLTRPLAEAIRGFDSGFGLGFVVGPLARSAAVWRKVFFFSSLRIRRVLVLCFAGGVSPPLPVVFLLFSVSYPQAHRSYYLFFNYLFLTTCKGLPNRRRIEGGGLPNRRRSSARGSPE